MIKYLFATLIFTCCFLCCTQKERGKRTLLKENTLPTTVLKIDITKDTVVLTPKGAVLKIPQGTLQTEGSTTVELEIKEAYNITDMIIAGLITESDGRPLSSGGMIYINARGENTVRITQKIAVAIPTPFIDEQMKLYKGEKDENGNLNWVQPDTMPKNPQLATLERGRAIFQRTCASCHAIGKKFTGPDLAHSYDRIKSRNDKGVDIYNVTRSYPKTMKETGDSYLNCVFERYNRLIMPFYPSLSKESIDELYAYIENETKIRNLPLTELDTLAACMDSCRTYSEIMGNLGKQKTKLIEENGLRVIENILNQQLPNANIVRGNSIIPDIDIVEPSQNRSVYYQFTIEAFGWYNVDVLLSEKNGSVESELMVRLTGQYRKSIDIYLVIPSARVLGAGGNIKDKEDEYGFYTTDGKIPLPQGVKAYIIMMIESEGQVLYAKREFITTPSQSFEVQLSAVTKEFFNKEMKALSFNDFSLKAEDSKNATEIHKAEGLMKTVEKLKPKNCDCHCGEIIKVDTSNSIKPVQFRSFSES